MSQYTEKEPSVMDQDSSKAAWPKPAGGYQTITGRRYGRRHAYVSFKPCMTRHERSLGRAGDDYEVLELDDVAKENTAGSSSLDQVHASLPSEPTVEKSETEIPTCGPALNESAESNPSIATVCHSEEVRETLDSSTDLQSHAERACTPAVCKNSAGDAEVVPQDGQEFQRSSEDGIVRKRRQDDTDQGRQTENSTEDADCVPGHVEQNTSERANHHGSSPEQVVRPKVRKVISSSQADQESGGNRHEAKQRSVQRWREALEVEECSSDDPIIKCDDYDGDHDCMFLTPSYSRVTPREAERHRATAENGATASGRQEARENAFWNACGEYYQLFDKDEDREQTSLEEGEIPWLQYNEVNESSSDEGNEPANEFAQPEAFMLDGNNNLEDDSSVSEDLDVDWRYGSVGLGSYP